MPRFYQTQFRDPRSAYVPLPLDAMAAKLASMQQAQDQYQQNVELLDKPFLNLPNDLEGAVAERNKTRSDLENLRNLDYNDPNNKRQIFDTIRNVRDSYGPQGTKGLYNAKALSFQAESQRLGKIAEKDPVKATFLMNELGKQATEKEFAITQDPITGQYKNTSLAPLPDWQYKDPNTTLGQYAKEVMMEAGVSGVKWDSTPAEAVKIWRETVTKSRDKDKLDYSLRQRIAGDPDLVMSAHALSTNNNLGTDETQFWTVVRKDKKGNDVYGWNKNTILGSAAEGTAYGAVESDISVQHGTVTDQTVIDRAKLDYEKKLKEENDFVLRGQLPVQKVDATSIQDQANNILKLKAEVEALKGKTDAESNAKRELLMAQITAAGNNLKLQEQTAYKNQAKTDWTNIQKFRTDISSRTGWSSDPLGVLMNTKEANEKIKNQDDYEAWLRGDIVLGTGASVTGTAAGVTGGGYYTEDQIRSSARNTAYDNAKDLEISSTETTLYGNEGSRLGNTSKALTEYVKTVPGNFITTDGSTTLVDWQKANKEALDDAEAKGKKVIMTTTPTTEGNFVVSYTDELGNPIEGVGVKTFQAVGENTNKQVQNIIGNDLIKLGESGTRPTDYANVRTGQIMVAESGNAGGAFKRQELALTAESIPDDSVTKDKPVVNVTVPAKTITVQTPTGPVNTKVQIVVSKTKDETGTVITTYKPTTVDGEGIFSGTEFGSVDGAFTNIDDMNIALEKDAQGLSENDILKQQKPVENNYR